ncbi:DUF4365 domain-containing protein [Tahibacter aquaticus]|nr:DUF4365 domain-containing protein [Tahibacter aquaticus]
MKGPELSPSQKIGGLGKRVFTGSHPDSWHQEGEPQQGGDFGFDVSMWLTGLGEIRGRFSVQLKSTTDAKVRGQNGDSYYSVVLTKEACELYFQDGQPVMLVLVVLDGEKTDGAKMYYAWITDQIAHRLGGKTEFSNSDPQEMSFHVPVAQALTKGLDISDYLDAFWTQNRIANNLRNTDAIPALRTIAALSPTAITNLGELVPTNFNRWLTNQALAGDALWASPKSDSLTAKIKQISDYLSHGNAVAARQTANEIGDPDQLENDPKAELHYQLGVLAQLDSDTPLALEHFRAATRANPDSAKYFIAEIEAELIVNAESASPVSDDTLSRSKRFSDNQAVKFQLVRIHALSGNRDEAERILTQMQGFEHREACVMFHSIQQDWTTAIAIAQEGIDSTANSKHRRLLNLLKARCLLHLVMGDRDGVQHGGRPDLQIEHVEQLRDTTLEALRDASLHGWPANTELLVDCASVVSLTTGVDSELYNLVNEFADRRPRNRALREAVARIATTLGWREAAAESLRKLPGRTIEDTARLIMAAGEAGNFKEAVSLGIEHIIDQPHSKLVDMAAVVATMSAYELGSIAEENRLRAYVENGSDAAKALLKFLELTRKNPATFAEHLDELWTAATAGAGDEAIQDNLFLHLRPTRRKDVERILSLGKLIQGRRRLTKMESGKYSAALLNEQRDKEVVDFTDQALRLFPGDENLALSKAIALDKLGQTAAAESLLSSFSDSDRLDLLKLRSQLVLRTGDIKSAVSLIQTALGKSKNPKDRFQLQRNLAILYSKLDPSLYFEAVCRLGEISDRNEESEEGTYLAQFALSSLGLGESVQTSRISEYHERIDAFTKKFPQSWFFRVGSIGAEGGSGDALAAIRQLADISDAKVLSQNRLRKLGERAGSLIPLVLRPGGIAPYCTNVVDLLSVCFYGRHDGQSSKILVGAPEIESRDVSRSPVIDLATVAVFVRLNLFDKLFSLWGAIAIPKVSLEAISQLGLEYLRSGANELTDAILVSIGRRKSQILQPGSFDEEAQNFAVRETSAIVAELVAGRHDYLTADVAAYVYVEGMGNLAGRCYSLWDFLTYAEKVGVLSKTDTRLIRLQVAAWNSDGVPLTPEDVAAAVNGFTDTMNDEADDAATTRVVRRFLEGCDSGAAVHRIGLTLIELMVSKDERREAAARWFGACCFREILLAQSSRFPAGADTLAAHILAVIAFLLNPSEAADVQAICRTLNSVRRGFGGNPDDDHFVRLLGLRSAEYLDKLFKSGELGDSAEEARRRSLLFSCVTGGTHAYDCLTQAYFQRTQELQKA